MHSSKHDQCFSKSFFDISADQCDLLLLPLRNSGRLVFLNKPISYFIAKKPEIQRNLSYFEAEAYFEAGNLHLPFKVRHSRPSKESGLNAALPERRFVERPEFAAVEFGAFGLQLPARFNSDEHMFGDGAFVKSVRLSGEFQFPVHRLI